MHKKWWNLNKKLANVAVELKHVFSKVISILAVFYYAVLPFAVCCGAQCGDAACKRA